MRERIPAAATAAAQRRVAAALRGGDVVVVPTDTVYALVADAFNPSAMRRLHRLKGREDGPPFSVVIRSPRQVTGLVSDIPEAADRLMAAYWPGPLTLVFAASEGLGWHLGPTRGTVGLRMPTDDLLLSIIGDVGPLACSGAHPDGRSAVSDVEEAEEALGDAVSLYVDGGHRGGPVSTIVDVTGPAVRVLREAAVPAAHVEQVASGALGWGIRPGQVSGPGQDSGKHPADTEEST